MTYPPTEHGRKTLYMTATALLRAERTQDRRKPSEGLESPAERREEVFWKEGEKIARELGWSL